MTPLPRDLAEWLPGDLPSGAIADWALVGRSFDRKHGEALVLRLVGGAPRLLTRPERFELFRGVPLAGDLPMSLAWRAGELHLEARTVDGIIATDRALDLTFTKRMSNRFSLVTSYYFNWDRDKEFVQNPNDERFADQTVTNWNFKIFGTYQAPWSINVTGSVRHQSGTAISRDVALSGQPGQNITMTGGNAYEAEENGAYRTDNVTVLDSKIERRFRFGGRSLGVFADLDRERAAAQPDFDKLMQEVAAFNKAHASALPPISDRLGAATQ